MIATVANPMPAAAEPTVAVNYDVLIVGAGMVGLSLAAALQSTSLKVGLIEARTEAEMAAHEDGRASAIALGSAQILDAIGAWKYIQSLGVSPLHRVEVSDQGQPLMTLHREDLNVDALGYVIENWVTRQGLQQRLAAVNDLTWFRPAQVKAVDTKPHSTVVTLEHQGGTHTIATQLLVAADGKASTVRDLVKLPVTSWTYEQALIVCTIQTDGSHQQTGYERFQPSGPFAILPMTPKSDAPDQYRSCIVWTANATEKDDLMALNDAEFIAALSPRLSPNLGQVLAVSPRYTYAPRRQHADRYSRDRVVLVGDAAHATHPVGGQGFNMGIRDVAVLASLLTQAHLQGRDLGDRALLTRYQHQRRWDNETVLFGTDTTNRLFSNQWPLVQELRQLALRGFDQILPLKQVLSRYAMGLADNHPQGIAAHLSLF